MDSLDNTQLRLLNLAKVPYSGYTEMLDYMKPIEALVEMIQFEAPILFSISTDETSLQEIVSELIEHEIESSGAVKIFGFEASQARIYKYLKGHNLPIRFFLMSLNPS